MSEHARTVAGSHAVNEVPDCIRCGARPFYDAATRSLRCPYCGTQQPVGEAPVPGSIAEIPLEAGFAQAPRGLGTSVRAVMCTTCGAVVHTTGPEVTNWCAFCRSHVVYYEPNLDLIRPESLIPFCLSREAANRLFANWLNSLWFRPSALSQLARIQFLEGLYVPYWTFDAMVHSDWTAQSGRYYYTTERYTETVNGKRVERTRQKRHTSWSPANGSRDDRYDDLLICASKGLPHAFLPEVGTFHTSALVPYDPGFLSGWRAEAYSVDLRTAWHTGAHPEVIRRQRERCASDVPGDTYADLVVNDHLTAITFKHVLLPIWIGCYWHAGQPYSFLVNGQTGKVAGKAPWSLLKILAVPLAIFAFGFLWWLAGTIIMALEK